MNQVHEGVKDLDYEPEKRTDDKEKPIGTSYTEIIQHRLLNNQTYYVPGHKRKRFFCKEMKIIKSNIIDFKKKNKIQKRR